MRDQSDLHPRQAQGHLVNEINSGEPLAGSRLRDVELAERLTIGRTAVREVLRMLETDGSVVHQPRQGAVVRTLDALVARDGMLQAAMQAHIEAALRFRLRILRLAEREPYAEGQNVT